MENCSISKIAKQSGISIDKIDLINQSLETEIKFEKTYNVVVDEIKISSNYIEFWITVPESSELKSSSGFAMQGIYLAKRFKEMIIEQIDYLNKELGMTKARIKIHYTSEEGSKWTEENSKEAIEKLEFDEIIKKAEEELKKG